uniref:FLYWCH-type domain-containing protein n=1 Tax=Strongyloides papillosus TaxID=174720 RepID=A0A0N5CIX3_STREA
MGFVYIYSRTLNEEKTWRCREQRSSKCKGTIKTRDDEVVQEPSQHSHGSCPQKSKANMLRYEMRKNMLSLNATPRNIIGHVLVESSNEVLAYMPKPTSLARSLRNQRLSNHLPNPVDKTFEIPENYADFLLYDT